MVAECYSVYEQYSSEIFRAQPRTDGRALRTPLRGEKAVARPECPALAALFCKRFERRAAPSLSRLARRLPPHQV